MRHLLKYIHFSPSVQPNLSCYKTPFKNIACANFYLHFYLQSFHLKKEIEAVNLFVLDKLLCYSEDAGYQLTDIK